jgi:putative chitinase
MVRGSSSFAEGAHVSYGQPLGEMGQTGSPGSIHAHVELEVGQFQRYIRDINDGTIRPGVIPRGGSAEQPVPVDGAVLAYGSRGAAVVELQKHLATLGYTNAQGQPLKSDGAFGPATRQAVEAFQRDHQLTVDGKVGPQTQGALERALRDHAAQKATTGGMLLSDPRNPDHALYEQALAQVKRIDEAMGRPSDEHTQRLAAAAVLVAKAHGLTRIDGIALSDDGSRTFVTQDDSPMKRIAELSTAQAVATPIEQSSEAARRGQTPTTQSPTPSRDTQLPLPQQSQASGATLVA